MGSRIKNLWELENHVFEGASEGHRNKQFCGNKKKKSIRASTMPKRRLQNRLSNPRSRLGGEGGGRVGLKKKTKASCFESQTTLTGEGKQVVR